MPPPDAPDFDQAAGLTYDQAPKYDEVLDPTYDDPTDPDYDEASQREFADDFTEIEYKEAGQECRPRKQKLKHSRPRSGVFFML